MTATPPLRADARRNRERILERARIAFAEHGAEASLDDIARGAGVGSGTLYRHFPTRTSLLEAVFGRSVEALSARADEEAGSGDTAAALRAWLLQLVEHIGTYRGIGRYLMENAADEHEMARTHDVIRDSLVRVLSPAQEAGTVRPDITATELLSLANGVALAARRPEQTARLLDLVLEGLTRPRGGPAPRDE